MAIHSGYTFFVPHHTQSITGRGSREPPGRWLASSVAGDVQWTSPPQDAHDNVSNPPVHAWVFLGLECVYFTKILKIVFVDFFLGRKLLYIIFIFLIFHEMTILIQPRVSLKGGQAESIEVSDTNSSFVL
jgi:hypothetical protein